MSHHDELAVLSRQLGYTFNDASLLDEALTHRSVGSLNNERLEFLGDGILNFVIADELFNKHPEMREGDLSRLRASLVNGETLASIARGLNLGDYLRLGTGELKSGGFRRSSILADAVESILGAVYCDSGFEDCRKLILKLFDEKLNNLPDVNSLKDPKTQLQELLQSHQMPLPTYKVLDVAGKAHEQLFQVECRIDALGCVTKARGGSRRKAEQIAASAAFEKLNKQLNDKS